jgi:hypothetical protein
MYSSTAVGAPKLCHILFRSVSLPTDPRSISDQGVERVFYALDRAGDGSCEGLGRVASRLEPAVPEPLPALLPVAAEREAHALM